MRAPGSIVIVVGTHLDKVSESESLFLEEEVRKRYRRGGVYPQVVGCFSVSSINKVFKSNIDNLRHFIYQVATHLKVTYKDGDKCESHDYHVIVVFCIKYLSVYSLVSLSFISTR